MGELKLLLSKTSSPAVLCRRPLYRLPRRSRCTALPTTLIALGAMSASKLLVENEFIAAVIILEDAVSL